MGEVSQARDTRPDRDVAIEVLPAAPNSDEERPTPCTRAANTTAALARPNVVALYDIGTREFARCLVEE